ncbi:hypothetical protein K501DRAFT_127541, partial [Backusella circina FSU 941]
MSFNIKSSFVSRSVVEDNKETQIESDKKLETEGVVIQEEYDPRTLFERLQEQKNLKEEKFQEESRLSNLIKRVDEEEAEYFRTLSDEKEKLEFEMRRKEELELEDYRKAVEESRSTSTTIPIPTLQPSNTTSHTVSKAQLKPRKQSKDQLKGLLVKKKDNSSDKKKKRGLDDDNDNDNDKDSTEYPAEKKVKSNQPATTSSLGLVAAYSDDSSSEE